MADAFRLYANVNPFHLKWKNKASLARVFEFYNLHHPGQPNALDRNEGGFIQWDEFCVFGPKLRIEIRDKKLPFLLRITLPRLSEQINELISELSLRDHKKKMKISRPETLLVEHEKKSSDTKEPSELPTESNKINADFPIALAVVDDEIFLAGNHILDLIGVLTVCFEILLNECEREKFHRVCRMMIEIIQAERLTAISQCSYRAYWESLSFTNVILCRFSLLYRKYVVTLLQPEHEFTI